MALKTYNPTTPGQRQLVMVDRSALYKGKPVKALTEGKISNGGRNNTGRITVLTLFTLTSNSFSTAVLICGLVAVEATLNTTLLCSDAVVAFSVMTGDRITSYRRGSVTSFAALLL